MNYPGGIRVLTGARSLAVIEVMIGMSYGHDKKSMRTLSIVVISFFIFAVSPPLYGASLLSDHLTDEGIEFYNQGRYDQAVHQLSKALLVDPENKLALEYLKKMGLSGGLYEPGETVLSQAGKLAGTVVSYRNWVQDLQYERDYITQEKRALQGQLENSLAALSRQQEERYRLRKENRDMQSEIRAKRNRINKMQTALEEERQQIARLNADLYDLADYAEGREMVVDRATAKLDSLHESYALSQQRWQEEVIEYQDLIAEMDRRRNLEKEEYLLAQNRYQQEINALRKRLKQATAEKRAAVEQLLVIAQKLNFIDGEIAERDITARDVRDSIDAIKIEMDALTPPGAPAAPATGDIPGAREAGNARPAGQRDRLVEDLQSQIEEAHKKLDAVVTGPIKDSSLSVAALKEQLAETSRQLEETRHLLEEKDADYEALKQKLKDTQERLHIVEELLKEKEDQLKQLEDQLTGILSFPE